MYVFISSTHFACGPATQRKGKCLLSACVGGGGRRVWGKEKNTYPILSDEIACILDLHDQP